MFPGFSRENRDITCWQKVAYFLGGLVVIPTVRSAASNGENVDLNVVTRIRQEGFRNSKVMEILQELTL